MRVGVIGPLGPDLFAENIADCLPDLGVDVVRLGPLRQVSSRPRMDAAVSAAATALVSLDDRAQRKVADAAIAAECDVVISIDGRLLPSAVERLRQARIRTVLWFPDHMGNLDRQMMFLAPYDRIYFTDQLLVDRTRALTTVPAAYLAEACNPRWHRRITTGPMLPAVVIAGNYYPTRIRLLDRLAADRVQLQLYGPPFPRWVPDRYSANYHMGRYVAGDDKARVFRHSVAVLNNLHPAENGVNCRLFEAAGCGAVVLCEDRPALHDVFDVGTEVLAFTTYDELLALCRRLLVEPLKNREIGDAASVRAHRDHTYQIRLRQILEDVA